MNGDVAGSGLEAYPADGACREGLTGQELGCLCGFAVGVGGRRDLE